MTDPDKPDAAAEPNKLGGVGADVRFTNGIGLHFTRVTRDSPVQKAGLTSMHEIIEIDNQSVQGLTPAEIRERLRGTVGSRVEIAAKQIHLQHPERYILTRTGEAADTSPEEELHAVFEKSASMIDKMYSKKASEIYSQGIKHQALKDFEPAEALFRIALTRGSVDSDLMSGGSIISHLADVGLFFLSIGSFVGAKEICDRMLECLPSITPQRMMLRQYELLDSLPHGLDELLIDKLYKALIDSCATKSNGVIPYTGYKFKYARFLAETNRFDDARKVIDQLLIFDESKPYYPNHTDLSSIGDLLALTGDFRQASELYDKAIDTYRSKIGKSQQSHDMFRPESVLLLKITVAALRDENPSAAAVAAKRIIDLYESVSEPQLVELEKQSSLRPSTSSILIVAAEVFALADRAEEAKHCFTRVVRLRTAALGADNPLSVVAKQKSEQSIRHREVLVHDIQSLLDSGALPGLTTARPETPIATFAIHKLIQNGNVEEAKLALRTLLIESQDLSPELLTACRFSAREIASVDHSSTLTFLKTLVNQSQLSPRLPAPQLMLWASLGGSAEEAHDEEAALLAWTQVEEILSSIQPSPESACMPLGEKFRFLANVFRINRNYEVSTRLMTQAELLDADADLLICDKALLLMDRGQIDEAKEQWKKIEILPNISKYADKLLELEKLFANVQDQVEHEELLKAATEDDRDDAVLKLAKFYDTHNRYPESEALLRSRIKSRNAIVDLKIALIESLEKQGRNFEALTLFDSIVANYKMTPNTQTGAQRRVLLRVVALQQKLTDTESSELIPVLQRLFDALMISGESAAAAQITERLLHLSGSKSEEESDDPEILKRIGQQHLQTQQIGKFIAIYRHLAFVYRDAGDIVECLKCLITISPEQFRTGDVEQCLSDAHLMLDLEESQASKQVIDRRQVCGENDLLVDLLIAANLIDEAVKLVDHAIMVRQKIYGASSQPVALALSWLVKVQEAQGANIQATLDQILQIYADCGGQNSPSSSASYPPFSVLTRVAYDRSEAGDCVQAIAILRQLAEIQDRYGRHTNLASTLSTMGSIHAQTGNYVEAEEALKRALHIKSRDLGIQHHAVQRLRNDYCDVLLKLGKPDEAHALMMNEVAPTPSSNPPLSDRSPAASTPDTPAPIPPLPIPPRPIRRNPRGCPAPPRPGHGGIPRLEAREQSVELGPECLDTLLTQLKLNKQSSGHFAVETMITTLTVSLVLLRKGDLAASRIWAARAKNAVKKLRVESRNEVVRSIDLAEKFGKLSERECAREVIEKVIDQIKSEGQRGQQLVRECCSILRECGFESCATELEESSKKW